MIITSLKLCNFRQYRGEHEVEFSTQSGQAVSVITGPNGAGKTGLFIALNWCLYGQGAANKGNLVNNGVLKARSGDEPVFVEVRFRHEGDQYVARRETPSNIRGTSTGELTLRRLDAGGRSKVVLNPAQRVSEILPPGARRYFFFDGEAIRSMSTVGNEAEVVEAMRSVLKLQVLERAVLHLTQVEKEFASDLRKTGAVDQETKELVKEIESVREQRP